MGSEIRGRSQRSKKDSTQSSSMVIRITYEKTIHSFLHGLDRSCSYLLRSSKPVEVR